MKRFFSFYLFLLVSGFVHPSYSQDLPNLPPSFLDEAAKDDNSLADLLKTDLLKRLVNTQKEQQQKNPSGRVRRPQPELGKGQSEYEPVDLSKYIGTEGDPQKAFEKLQDLGKVPKVPGPIEAPFPTSATKEENLWKDVPPEKRLAYVNDLLERKRVDEGLTEIENLLDSNLKPKDKINALALREKLLLKDRRYDMVESDYFRLKNYYPEEKVIDELKEYLEKESGLQPLQEAAKQNPADPSAQRKLLDQYLKFGWLDFAEEFFAETIQDTSKPTIESLSEIYYRKHDFPMLIKLNEAAQTVHPHEPVFPYNQAVGILNEQNPGAEAEAVELFKKARNLTRTPAMQQRIDWYLNRLDKK